MDTRRLVGMIDTKTRRLEREIAELRRLTAQLRDTVAETDTEREDTGEDGSAEQ